MIALISIIHPSCYYPIDDISNISGIDIKESVHFETTKRGETEGLNADFTCVYLYSIIDSSVIVKKWTNRF